MSAHKKCPRSPGMAAGALTLAETKMKTMEVYHKTAESARGVWP